MSTGKNQFPCSGGYVTHRWDGPVSNQPITPHLMARECQRCGITFAKLYEFRKVDMAAKYKEAKAEEKDGQ